jgi:hypothetical protein
LSLEKKIRKTLLPELTVLKRKKSGKKQSNEAHGQLRKSWKLKAGSKKKPYKKTCAGEGKNNVLGST